jgi:hypothetical protein
VDFLGIGPAAVLAAPSQHRGVVQAGFGLRRHLRIGDAQEVAEVLVESPSQIRVVFVRQLAALLHADFVEHARQIKKIARAFVGAAGEFPGHGLHLARRDMRSPSPGGCEIRMMPRG